MKKLTAIFLSLALLLTAAAPAFAADEPGQDIPVEDVIAEGPESVRQGEVVLVSVRATSENHGVSARIETAGLEILTRIGGAISEDAERRLLLDADEAQAVFVCRVTGAAGEDAVLDIHDAHILEDGTDRMGTSAPWEAQIQEGEPTEGPLTYSELRDACGKENEDATIDAFAEGLEGVVWADYLPILSADDATALVFGGEDQTLLADDALTAEKVSTGQAVALFSKDAEPESFSEIIVSGDVLGTGEFNIAQLTRLAQAVNGSKPLTGVYLAAGKVAGGEELSISDLVAAARMLTED